MKCLGCGNELNEGQSTCPYCGNNVSNANPNNQVNQWQQGLNNPVNHQPNNNQPDLNNNKKTNITGILIVILLLSAIVFGIWFIAFSGGSKNESEENNANSQNIENNEENNYIENSKKAAFADTISAFIAATMNKVNEGKDFQFYSTSDLYMVPIGNGNKSCVSVEGGSSPYSKNWNFAYIGVTYDGAGYDYYFIGEDGAGYGFEFIDRLTLVKGIYDKFYNTKNPSSKPYLDSLKKQYLNTTDDGIYYDSFADSSEYSELLNNVSRKTIKFIRSGVCKYK